VIQLLAEEAMEPASLESLEKRVAAIEKSLAQLLRAPTQPAAWKDWRLAVGKVKRTDLAEEVDAAAREFREADRRQAQS
jgi:hypothetical protein